MATTLVLARHGETDWNRHRRFQGHADVPLNEAGRAQARRLASEVAAEVGRIVYSSPLRRALETAEIVGAHLELEVRTAEALREVDVGSWSGLSVPEVEKRFPAGFARWRDWRLHGWEDGESYEKLSERVVEGLRGIAARHPDERILAVTHGGPIRCAVAAARGVSLAEAGAKLEVVENCAIVRIAVRDGKLEAVD